MSLTDSPDCSFRAEDKALKMLFPSTEDPVPNSFDEYFDRELFELNNGGSDDDSPPLDDYLADTQFGSSSPSPSKPLSIKRDNTPQPWRKGIWCMNSRSTPELSIAKTRKSHRSSPKFISPSHLSSNNNFAVQSPVSLTRISTSTKVSPTSKPFKADNEQHIGIAVTREQSQSPTPVFRHRKMNNDQWQQDFQNFHLHAPEHGTHLSSYSTNPSIHHGMALRQANSMIVARNATVGHKFQSPTKYHHPFGRVQRQEEEYPEINGVDIPISNLHGAKLEHQQIAPYAHVGSDHHAAPVWTTESLHSSSDSHQSYGSHYSADNHCNAYSNQQAQAWVSTSPTNLMTSHHEEPVPIAAPIPQRVPHQVLYQHPDQYPAGLGIHYADTEHIGRAVSYGHEYGHRLGYVSMTPPPPMPHLNAYPPLPPYPCQVVPDVSPFSTPHRHKVYSHSRSPSPTFSPTRRSTSRNVSQRSPTRDHTRRKSIHKTGPIKDMHIDVHARTRSASRPPRTPKTPKTPKTPSSAGFAQIGFVNYTPKDSYKLMSDVAPSGSSKTRAKRDQAAKEKQRKLNEAAILAIRKAGGDVSALEEVILVS